MNYGMHAPVFVFMCPLSLKVTWNRFYKSPLFYPVKQMSSSLQDKHFACVLICIQVDACMNQDGTMEMPIYDMPYRILCTVMHVRPKVERSTDEVFAYKLSTFTPRKLVHSSLVRNSLRLSCSKQKAGTDDASYSSPVFSSLLIDTQQLYSACCMVQLSSNLEVAQGSCKVKKIVTQIVEISVRVPKNAHQSRGRNRKAES
ncbi:hypothetical protein V6N11_016002 [Hibiscus sabdariffa]|uniref:Uncharacterized protein n=1 Tax=Hibiscus sabdariffa TaxID=183260 RepID=A0ABR2TU48_9ROSI